jgi:hypothetical protein
MISVDAGSPSNEGGLSYLMASQLAPILAICKLCIHLELFG